MKPIFYLLILFGLASCSEAESNIETQTQEVDSSVEFVKYTSVIEMLRSSYDFNEENGGLKILSQDVENIHVQVSKLVVDGDSEKYITEQTMRDIVYVAFQSFAETDVSQLIITSVPMKAKNEYIDKYRMTVKVNRETAKAILKKYLKTENFKELYRLEGTIWVPSEKFDDLKFKNLNSVYKELKG